MKKTIFLTHLCLLGMGAVTTAKADSKGYTVFEKSTGVLTFYYDELSETRTEGIIELIPDLKQPPTSRFKGYNKLVKKAVIDASFAELKQNTGEGFFLGFDENGLILLERMEPIEGMENINTSEMTTMSGMFQGCTMLKEIDLSHSNTEKVKDMGDMFFMCESLEFLDLRSFKTDHLENTANMFYGCSLLEGINISSFNTANVTDMSGMFMECSALKEIDLSRFNTGNVTDMPQMFADCENITSLDLRSFNMDKVEIVSEMFYGCEELTTIYCNEDWSNYNLLGIDMFTDCKKLVGGNGTVYDENKVDVEYARPDGGILVPGYFTEKEEVIPYSVTATVTPAEAGVVKGQGDYEYTRQGCKVNTQYVSSTKSHHFGAI